MNPQRTIPHFSIYEALPEEELLITRSEKEDFMGRIYDRFNEYGMMPGCRGCKHDCVQYNAPSLIKFECYVRGGNNGSFIQRQENQSITSTS